ncbi:hypothetical protein [Kitasatospora sp. NPDC086791]|uniref:hypothetical protein n=1 Tax=Kitasatospora sp. NPDC086791 TaxID=3155178 RepID=UPI003412E465
MKHQPFHHRARGRSRKVMALSLGLGSVLTAGAAVLGVSFAATTPAPPAQPNMNCTLKVPANPLTAAGLATPYVLSATNAAQGACHEANANQSAFVQATVLDPATGAVSVYNPLVVDKRTKPAAAPVVPALPAGAVVGIWFGFNGNVLTMTGQTAAGKCVGGTPGGQPFGQFAYCNAPAFFAAANAADKAGKLKIPALGTAKDGKPCPTTRDYGVVDQDQSDNVTSEYLATAKGTTAQRTKKNTAALGGGMKAMKPTALLNGSDNLLLDNFIDPALGCTPWTAPDLADPGSNVTSLALNELQAAKFQAAPMALVPLSDPMVQENGKQSPAKVNLYRAGVNQPPLGGAANGDSTEYCTGMTTAGAQRIALDRQFTTAAASPQAGQNLFDFLSQRYTASLTTLGCTQPAPTPTPTTAPTPTGKPSPGASGKPTATPSPTTSGKPTASPTMSGKPTANPSPSMSGKPTGAPTVPAKPTAPPSPSATPTAPVTTFPPCCTAGQ